MASSNEPIGLQVKNSFKKLYATSSRLNTVSDELSCLIGELETALQTINLGVAAWVQIESEEDPTGTWVTRSLGYDKLQKGWGIALNAVSGHYSYPDDDTVTQWTFNEGPRWLRIKAIKHIPALINALNEKAEEITKHLDEQIIEAKEVTEAIKSILPVKLAGAVKK